MKLMSYRIFIFAPGCIGRERGTPSYIGRENIIFAPGCIGSTERERGRAGMHAWEAGGFDEMRYARLPHSRPRLSVQRIG